MNKNQYRIWDTIDKRMIYAEEAIDMKSVLAIGLHGLPIVVDEASFKGEDVFAWNVDHNRIPLQITGMKDRLGANIYDGDILSIPEFQHRGDGYYDDVLGAVSWDTTGLFWQFRYGAHGYDFLSEAADPLIVGNIYENKHLIDPDVKPFEGLS